MPDSKRILFIDSDPEWRALGIEALVEGGFGPKDGYVIVELGTVETGFATIERDRDFIAVITAWKNPDVKTLQYPKFNGLELLRRLRDHEDEKIRKLPVIVHTIAESHSCIHAIFVAGYAAVVSKFRTDRLPATLQTLLAAGPNYPSR